MKSNHSDITIVLDRSGSMQSVRADTIGGFNAFLESQKKLPGSCAVSLVQFDDIYEVVYAGRQLSEAPALNPDTFVPRGSTALLDAIGRSINSAGQRFAALPEHDKPSSVIFVVVTDGQENASREFNKKQVMDLITHQREKYNWQFVFLGANQDAIASAASMGIGRGDSLTYASNSVGVARAFASTADLIGKKRAGNFGASYSDGDRDQQKSAGA